MLISKIFKKVKNIIRIYNVNKAKKCDISYTSNIYGNTCFEGRNYIGKNVNLINTEVGYGTYVGNNTTFSKTSIGKFCSISSNVSLIIGCHPTEKFISTYPGFFSTRKYAGLTYCQKDRFEECRYTDESKELICKIGNDVWIGEGAKIMSGITIEDRSSNCYSELLLQKMLSLMQL